MIEILDVNLLRASTGLPWDCDETMGIREEPPRDLGNVSLRLRSEYDYGFAAENVFLESLRTRFRIPIGPILQSPQKKGSNWLFSWKPTYDVTGTSGGISYRLQLARTPTFTADQ